MFDYVEKIERKSTVLICWIIRIKVSIKKKHTLQIRIQQFLVPVNYRVWPHSITNTARHAAGELFASTLHTM